jgi:hypothetical protein
MRPLILFSALIAAAPAPAQAPSRMAVEAGTVDPARQAAAEKVVGALVPQGIYLRIMRDQFPKMMDVMMGQMGSMTGAELGRTGGEALDTTARNADPHFAERMRIMTKVMGEEMGVVMDRIEPRVRAGLSRAFARKYTAAQLSDMNAFFGTPSGKAFASGYLLQFTDPELMREMATVAPEMIQAMPAVMKKVEAATAHLPMPPKSEATK